MKITKQLKKELWQRFGTTNYPAEWDGIVYGGGKLSQRFWEYFIIIEYLKLEKDSVVLDIGGGSPKTGYGFFSQIIAKYIKKVIIFDPNAKQIQKHLDNIEIIREEANYESLNKVLSENRITHISCISVFEHIKPQLRQNIIKAINDHFTGRIFTATYEYHPRKKFFQEQLTTKSASEMFSNFSNFYLAEYTSSPTLCENAFAKRGLPLPRILVQRWYPVAVKFENCRTRL